jgi:rod shape-determining protein MreC
LLALNGLPTLAGIDSVTAQVVGQSPSNFTQTFELNRGKSSGIRVGMTVTNGAGLVGKITGVTLERSVVMLATDPEYAMSVKVGACTRPNTTTTAPPQTTTTLATDGPSTADTMAPGDGVTAPVTTVAPSTTTTTSTTSTTTTVLPRATTTTIKGFTPFATTLPPIPGGGGATQITVPESGVLLPRETGAMEGQGIDRLPVIRFIQSSSRLGELCAGVPVVTAGGSQSLAPADLVVGTVSRVVTRTGTSGPLLEVELAANLGSLNFVRVLLYQPATEIPQ